MLWRSEVGISGWLDNPVIADGAVYVGSAGVAQFSQDRLDGIHSVDLVTGQRRWFYTTELDVNAVSVSGNYVVATGDEGRVWVIDARDGDLVWTELLGVPVFGSPLILGDIVYFGAGDDPSSRTTSAAETGSNDSRWRVRSVAVSRPTGSTSTWPGRRIRW